MVLVTGAGFGWVLGTGTATVKQILSYILSNRIAILSLLDAIQKATMIIPGRSWL